MQACELDDLADRYGSDKGPLFHRYTLIYDSYFSRFKDKPIKLLEIGFWQGASARMWQDYFPHAQELHFMDINDKCWEHLQGLTSKCKLHKANQHDKAELLEVAAQSGGEFDIIIDDGCHFMGAQILSFQTLFPFLKSGGVYVVEDLHTSYWKDFGSEGSTSNPKAGAASAIRFFQNLIDDLNYGCARCGSADKTKWPEEVNRSLNYHQEHIESIHFYPSLCIIIKR